MNKVNEWSGISLERTHMLNKKLGGRGDRSARYIIHRNKHLLGESSRDTSVCEQQIL